MNILTIIVLSFFLLKDKFDFSSLINSLDVEGLRPILQLLNVDESILNLLNGDNLKQLLNGNFDFKTLLPLITPLLTSLLKPNTNAFNSNNYNQNFEDFSLIKDIAGQDVAQAFENYFE